MTMSRNSSLSEEHSELVDKKSYIKIDPIGKLHIIYSLDNGNSKADIARIYGVPPKTITYIYSQRELILKKYEYKYNHLKEVRLLNLDQILLDWFKAQILNDVTVTENDLLEKAQELTQHINKEFIHTKDWLLDFRRRHNIIKYIPEESHKRETVDEWRRFMTKVDSDNLYVCGTCAIYHSLFLDLYAAGEVPEDYMSVLFIVHTSGSYKRKLAIAGKEQINVDIGSLPANYYANDCYINQRTIVSHLQEWDNELSSEGRTVLLAMNMPNSNLLNMQLKNIKIIPTSLEFLSKGLEKIVECFKYHFKEHQIMKKIEHGNYLYLELLDYINMISLAWYSVPDFYIKQIFNPAIEGSLYLRPVDACDGNHSLLHWCEIYNIPLDMQLYGPYLEQYVFCDKNLKSIDFDDRSEIYEPNKTAQPSSSMEAYQAMKRLLSYVQGERASEHVLQSAKLLENHLEYGTLLEIHDIIARNNSE